MNTQKKSLAPRSLVFRMAIFLLLINLLFLLFSLQGLPENREIFFFPLLIDKLVYWQGFSILITILIVFNWTGKQTDRKQGNKIRIYLFFAVVILLGMLVAADMYGGILFGYLNLSGKTEFQGASYYLIDAYVFDEGTTIYLGKCERLEFRCRSHKIFVLYDGPIYPSFLPQISLSNNGDELSVLVDGYLVYIYNVEGEECIEQIPGGYGYWYCPDS